MRFQNCTVLVVQLTTFFSIVQYLGIISESCKIGVVRILPL
jgi:hypothetical protein